MQSDCPPPLSGRPAAPYARQIRVLLLLLQRHRMGLKLGQQAVKQGQLFIAEDGHDVGMNLDHLGQDQAVHAPPLLGQINGHAPTVSIQRLAQHPAFFLQAAERPRSARPVQLHLLRQLGGQQTLLGRQRRHHSPFATREAEAGLAHAHGHSARHAKEAADAKQQHLLNGGGLSGIHGDELIRSIVDVTSTVSIPNTETKGSAGDFRKCQHFPQTRE